jgi:hypothetical protein
LKCIILELILQRLHANALRKILDKDLDEDTARAGSVFLIQANDMKDLPPNRVGRQEVPEKLSDDSQAVRFVPMDRLVILGEHVLKQVLPEAIELAKSLSNETEKLVVCAFLTAAFDDHGRQLIFLASRQVDPHELVTRFLELSGRHDCQVDGPSKVNQICV